MEDLYIIKIGGNIIDNNEKLDQFLDKFSELEGLKLLIHGGGKLATNLANQLEIQQEMIDGRRVTDAETIKIVTMVYAGLVNKTIVAKLQSRGCNSIGLSGMDANCLLSSKRNHPTIDFGWVGDIKSINVGFFESLFEQNIVPVVSPISHDNKGNLLNTNADTIATELAIALTEKYNVKLRYCFEKLGVLVDPEDDSSWLKSLDKSLYEELKDKQIISKGMLPKLENAFKASNSGLGDVEICHADYATEIKNFIGTKII
ncbi:MAG: acetylglutamate kinase [Limnohabitans sp.]|nr:acetylglutamate kinase [Limnohabitans sp.]